MVTVNELPRRSRLSDRLGREIENQLGQRSLALQRFRSAMDVTADAIFLISRKTMLFVDVNQSACDLLGYRREELFAAGPSELWPSTTQRLEDAFDAIIADRCDAGLTVSRMRHRHGHLVDVEMHQQAQASGDDWLIVGVVRDITQRKAIEKDLHRLAHYDALTALPNRALFHSTLERTIEQARTNDWQVAVMFIDLDNFKAVNDTLGHAIGDELLSQLGNRLVKCVRTRDVIGRLGGDEFALILVMNDCRQGAGIVASKVHEALRRPFYLMGHDVSVTASIGVTIFPEDAADSEGLLKFADMAMYRAKHAGRDATRFFTAQMNIEVLERMALETALRAAILNQEFVLHYQPKLDAVNISGRQFRDGDLAKDVADALGASGIPPHLLELELTESSLMENTERTVATLTAIKAMGVAITIDDFGTGYSSLAYLRRFPIDKLKIDIAFIRDITKSEDDATIALAIISMAHSLKLTVIAEGVETTEQLTYLRRHRCDQIQGYYFSRPLSAPEMEWMLLDRAL